MTTALIQAGGQSSVTLYGVTVQPAAIAPTDGVAIRFPGMSGAVFQKGARRYPAYTIQGTIRSSTSGVAGIDAQLGGLGTTMAAMCGRDTDLIKITYSDSSGSVTTLYRLVQIAPIETEEVTIEDDTYQRGITLTVETLS